MKTYEEMTESVLNRACRRQQKYEQRRSYVINVTVVMSCICLVVFGLWSLLLPNARITPQVQNREPRTRFILVSRASEIAPTELIKDIKVPCMSRIRVLDISKMSKAEQDMAWVDERISARQEMEGQNSCASFHRSDTAIVSMISSGLLELVIGDLNTVVNMEVTSTKTGSANRLGYAIYYEEDDSLVVYWSLSDEGIKMIDENPKINLSELSFALTITVEFKDGSKECAMIDMLIDEEGYVYAVQRGITVSG